MAESPNIPGVPALTAPRSRPNKIGFLTESLFLSLDRSRYWVTLSVKRSGVVKWKEAARGGHEEGLGDRQDRGSLGI